MRQAKDAATGTRRRRRPCDRSRHVRRGGRECDQRGGPGGRHEGGAGRAVDVHVHCGPEGIPRRYDPVQIATHAAEVGLRTMVLKSHFTGTSGWAEIAHRLTGVRLYGSVTLNHHVGGINPFAVRAALGSGRRRRQLSQGGLAAHGARRRASRGAARARGAPRRAAGVVGRRPVAVAEPLDAVPPISVLADSIQGRLDDVLRLIASHRLILATGHVGRDEVFHVVERARALGVERIVVTHAHERPAGAAGGRPPDAGGSRGVPGAHLRHGRHGPRLGPGHRRDHPRVGVAPHRPQQRPRADRPAPAGRGSGPLPRAPARRGHHGPRVARSASGTTRSPSSRRTVGARDPSAPPRRGGRRPPCRRAPSRRPRGRPP